MPRSRLDRETARLGLRHDRWSAGRGYPDYQDGWWIAPSEIVVGKRYTDVVQMRDETGRVTEKMGGRRLAIVLDDSDDGDSREVAYRLDTGEIWTLIYNGTAWRDDDGPEWTSCDGAAVNG